MKGRCGSSPKVNHDLKRMMERCLANANNSVVSNGLLKSADEVFVAASQGFGCWCFLAILRKVREKEKTLIKRRKVLKDRGLAHPKGPAERM